MQVIKESLRKKILEVGLKEFEEKGYEGTSMRAISEGAGTSLGNLYHYFHSKDDIYASCLRPVLDECIRCMSALFDVSDAAIAQTAFHMARYVTEHSREFKIIVDGPVKHYAAFLERFTNCIAEKLKEHAMEVGVDCVTNPDFYGAVALAFISSLRGIMENSQNEAQTQAHIRELMFFMFAGYRSRMEALRVEP